MADFNDPASIDEKDGPKPPPTVLRGPEHAENYRTKVGRYKERWYIDPLPADEVAPEALPDESHPSVSTVKSAASGKDWTFVSLKRVAHAEDLAAIAALGFYERYERLKVINTVDLSKAQRRGTNVHTWAESRAYGVKSKLGPKAEGAEYFPIVDKFFDDMQPELVAAEFVCIHRTLNGIGYGGTADGIFRIEGKNYKLDWKSRGEDSDHGAYPEEAAQLGAYMGAEYVIVADDDPANPYGAKRIPVPHVDGALIISIKPDSYEVYPVDLPASIEMFQSMHAWWLARRTEAKLVGKKWAPRSLTPTPSPTPAVVQCVCGELSVAVGTRVEIRGVSHGETPCYVCDDYGKPVAEPEPPTTDELEQELVGVTEEERRTALYARHAALTAEQQEEFAERILSIDKTDLDAVDRLISDIENPPSMLTLAQRRMAKDADREADRRLSAEGGPANPEDVVEIEVRWELQLSEAGKKWLGVVVEEAIMGKVEFLLSHLSSQRRADLYCALTEYASLDLFRTPRAEQHLREAIVAASGRPADGPIGVCVGSLSTDEAATLRHIVTEIGAGRMTYVVDPDGVARWSRVDDTKQERENKT
jgi:hypothetical protein